LGELVEFVSGEIVGVGHISIATERCVPVS
jgi:hypothetical protein